MKKKKMMMMMMYYILCTLMGMYSMFHCQVKIMRGINPQFPDGCLGVFRKTQPTTAQLPTTGF